MSGSVGRRVPKIYALADQDTLGRMRLPEAVTRLAAGGVRWIQVRAKHAVDAELAADLDSCCRALEGSETQLWINDRPDLARLYPVHGVHLGQSDLEPRAARRVVGRGRMIGLSTHNERQVREADADEAVDIIAIGPVFLTTGKQNPEAVVGLTGVRRARRLTNKPLVAIGGVNTGNLGELLEAGADAAAILGAICRGDIDANCRRLVALVESAA